MPWTVDDPPNPAKNKPVTQRRACVSAANAAIRDNPDDEAGAIFACIGAMKGVQKIEGAVVTFRKADEMLQIVWGEVYVPMVPDSEGDFMTAVEVRKTAHGFCASGLTGNVDTNHDYTFGDARVVESFVARAGDSDFIEGAWVAAVHVPDKKQWQAIMNGELNSFSMAGISKQIKGVELEMNAQPTLTGRTAEFNDHAHDFQVFFDHDNEFLGGETSVVDGHRHVIKRGTLTEPGGEDGHAHRFSFVEDLVGD